MNAVILLQSIQTVAITYLVVHFARVSVGDIVLPQNKLSETVFKHLKQYSVLYKN